MAEICNITQIQIAGKVYKQPAIFSCFTVLSISGLHVHFLEQLLVTILSHVWAPPIFYEFVVQSY